MASSVRLRLAPTGRWGEPTTPSGVCRRRAAEHVGRRTRQGRFPVVPLWCLRATARTSTRPYGPYVGLYVQASVVSKTTVFDTTPHALQGQPLRRKGPRSDVGDIRMSDRVAVLFVWETAQVEMRY